MRSLFATAQTHIKWIIARRAYCGRWDENGAPEQTNIIKIIIINSFEFVLGAWENETQKTHHYAAMCIPFCLDYERYSANIQKHTNLLMISDFNLRPWHGISVGWHGMNGGASASCERFWLGSILLRRRFIIIIIILWNMYLSRSFFRCSVVRVYTKQTERICTVGFLIWNFTLKFSSLFRWNVIVVGIRSGSLCIFTINCFTIITVARGRQRHTMYIVHFILYRLAQVHCFRIVFLETSNGRRLELKRIFFCSWKWDEREVLPISIYVDRFTVAAGICLCQ